jgi:uncharacterized protein YutE (UPF0331/DUF86 family)
MTQGPVNLKVVGDRLALARRCLADLEALQALGADEFERDRRNPAAADSFLRRAIEALFDAARHVLAKRHGLAGLEYREVARLSVEHGLVTDTGLAPRLLKIAGFRNRLAHYYDEVTPAELFGVIASGLGDLHAFAREIEASAARLPRE